MKFEGTVNSGRIANTKGPHYEVVAKADKSTNFVYLKFEANPIKDIKILVDVCIGAPCSENTIIDDLVVLNNEKIQFRRYIAAGQRVSIRCESEEANNDLNYTIELSNNDR